MKEKYPIVGDYPNFCLAVKNQNFSVKAVSLAFTKLVSKIEYDKKDRKRLVKELEKVLKPAYDGGFEAKFPSDWTIGLGEVIPIISSIK